MTCLYVYDILYIAPWRHRGVASSRMERIFALFIFIINYYVQQQQATLLATRCQMFHSFTFYVRQLTMDLMADGRWQ